MKNFKIVLVNPPYNPPIGQSVTVGQPLGIAYLAQALRNNNFQVEILDAVLENLSKEKVKDRLLEIKANMIGISVCQGAVSFLSYIVDEMKSERPDSYIAIGGTTPTLVYDRIYKEIPLIDCIMLGEGEETICELAQCIKDGEDWRKVDGIVYCENGQLIQTPLRPICNDIDEIAQPSDDYYPIAISKWGIDEMGIMSSRGCYGNCKFCTMPNYYKMIKAKKRRTRRPEKVLDEILETREKWNVPIVDLHDDNFFGPGENGMTFAEDFVNEIKRRGVEIQFKIFARINDLNRELFQQLKDAGMVSVFIGVESINERALKFYNKGIHESQIEQGLAMLDELDQDYVMGYILFDPYVTFEEIKKSIGFLKKVLYRPNNKTMVINEYINVTLGSGLEQELRDDNLLFRDDIYIDYSVNYKFKNPDVQIMSDIFYKLWIEEIIPAIKYSWVSVQLSKECTVFKLDIIMQIITMIESGTLESGYKEFYENEFTPKLKKLSDRLFEAYIHKLRESI